MESRILSMDSLISASVFSTEVLNELILPIHIPMLTRLPIAPKSTAYVTGFSHMMYSEPINRGR